MATLVLVHGAWGGAHGFRRVRQLLREQGHEVSTPSLTGIGERVHLASPMVNLTTHVCDVVNHVLYEHLEQITLVGFSYGGMVVSGALEHIAGRVRHLVFLDAFVPDSGDSVASLLGGESRPRIELGKDWLVSAPRAGPRPTRPPWGSRKLGAALRFLKSGPVREYDDPAEARWMGARRTAHPEACFTEPVHLAQDLESFPFTRTYLTSSPPLAFGHRLRGKGGDSYGAQA